MGESSTPRTQASTPSTRTTTYTDYDKYGTNVEHYDMPDTYGRDWSYSTSQPPGYDQVHRPESLWQPYYMETYENELEIVDELQYLGEFGMKLPYQFGTHEEDPLARYYSKLDPNVPVIASNSVEKHHPLNQRQTHAESRTRECINNLREVINIDVWRTAAAFPFGLMRAACDTSFDENENSGSAPGYQWYSRIQAACGNSPSALVTWRNWDEEIDFKFRNRLEEENLPNDIRRLNRMHRQLCAISDPIHFVD